MSRSYSLFSSSYTNRPILSLAFSRMMTSLFYELCYLLQAGHNLLMASRPIISFHQLAQCVYYTYNLSESYSHVLLC